MMMGCVEMLDQEMSRMQHMTEKYPDIEVSFK